jgi:hypothetical protein
MVWEGIKWIHLAQHREMTEALINIIKTLLKINCSICFSIVALLHVSVMQSKLDTKMALSCHLLASSLTKGRSNFTILT